MNFKEFTVDQIINLYFEEGTPDYEYNLLYTDDWEQDGKYQSTFFYIKGPYNDVHCFSIYRSGSPFSEWHYDNAHYNGQVRPKLIERWEWELIDESSSNHNVDSKPTYMNDVLTTLLKTD